MLRGLLTSAVVPILSLFATAPSGTTYTLQSYGVGSGGVANASSTTYSMNGITGELSGTQLDGTSYSAQPGLIPTQQANVPPAPTFTNPSNYYNKLHLVINAGGNPSDTNFAIAISSDNFATTQYVQSDNTVGTALGSEDYQTYALWGGGSGFDIIGLQPNTTYKVKLTAMQGAFSQSAYGPTASAATVNPSLTFDIDISASDTDTNPPYAISFSNLLPGSVTDSPQKIWLDFDTNAGSGGNTYIYGQNAGLRSTKAGYTLSSITGDLSALSQGFGGQSASATQTSGGPFTATSPYNGASQNVGIIDTSIRKLYGASAPVTAGRSSILLKAKVSNTTPSASDYAETLTILASTGY
jgi:hypothetical protein